HSHGFLIPYRRKISKKLTFTPPAKSSRSAYSWLRKLLVCDFLHTTRGVRRSPDAHAGTRRRVENRLGTDAHLQHNHGCRSRSSTSGPGVVRSGSVQRTSAKHRLGT